MFDRIQKGLWWDKPLTLVEGCTKVSPGCDNCWAESIARRFQKPDAWGTAKERSAGLMLPHDRKKPTAWAVWNDLFHEDVSYHFIAASLLMMANCSQHIFMVLTKRAERMRDATLAFGGVPNIWLGVTAENQEQADKRIPILLQTSAAVRFVSIEPILGPVSFRWAMWHNYFPEGWRERKEVQGHLDGMEGISWVILGAESGPNARSMELDWARSVRDQCREAGVPLFIKQLRVRGQLVKDINLFPDDLRVRELPI